MRTGRPTADRNSYLVLNYQPSQPTGWPPNDPAQGVGATTGGHVSSRTFSDKGKSYRISLLSFGAAGDSADPVYRDVPTDPDFKPTLAGSFGTHYSFRYLGFQGRHQLDVQSYAVYVRDQWYGADLYVVYHTDRRRHSARGTLRWIQVSTSPGPDGRPRTVVENRGRANPFLPNGGSTSIYGRRVVNLHYDAAEPIIHGPDGGPTVRLGRFTAEVFLVLDTGTKDRAGKDVINVLGGMKYGWQIQELAR